MTKRFLLTLSRLVLTSVYLLLMLANPPAHAQDPYARPDYVLVVANQNNAQSMALASHYMQARNIPANNLLLLNENADDNYTTISLAEYHYSIYNVVTGKIASLPHIDYIVICRNLPYLIADNGCSVDSMLAQRNPGTSPYSYFYGNPYFGQGFTRFNSSVYNMYIVTRLDGWSWADANALVDRSLQVRRAPVFMDLDPTIAAPDPNSFYNADMQQACTLLGYCPWHATMDNSTTFVNPQTPLGGYASWGSNDRHFDPNVYASLTFTPGAVVTTAVSTAASNIRYPGGWQSQIAQLVHQGATGAEGCVTEPYSFALSRPSELFFKYAWGVNLGSSYYGAMPVIAWKNVVLGDPLCTHYGQ